MTTTTINATIDWQTAVDAVFRIVADAPHLGREFSIHDAERLEITARAIRQAIDRSKTNAL